MTPLVERGATFSSGGRPCLTSGTSTSSGCGAAVLVTGTAPALLDLRLGRIRESASAPVERVTRP